MHISVLGTGAIGAAFAEAFLKAGHRVTVYNRTLDKVAQLVALGAVAAASAEQAVQDADATLIAVTDGKALAAMLGALAPASLQGAKILNVSTTRVSEITAMGADLATLGAALAEVSVNVGPDQIRDGQGAYLLGSAAADVALWQGLLEQIGGMVHLAGDLGAASRAELPLLLAYLFGLTAAAHIVVVEDHYMTPKDILAAYVYPAMPAAQYAVPQMMARAYADASASVQAFQGLAENAVQDFAVMGYSTAVLDAMVDLFARAAAAGFASKDGAAVVEGLRAR